jgi:hypothetical protein
VNRHKVFLRDFFPTQQTLEVEVLKLRSSQTAAEDQLGRGVVLRRTSCERYVNDFD